MNSKLLLVGFIKCLLLFNSAILNAQIQGFVFDETQTPLPGANILLLPDSLQNSTNSDGKFSYSELPDGLYSLQIGFIGYAPVDTLVNVSNGRAPNLYLFLSPRNNLLEQVEVTEEHAKQEESLSSEHLSEVFFQENMQGAFAKSIEKIPGISAINVGVGIAKPVIRGLSSNRIIVNHQGIKQESQQWGSDHGLEIDQFDVERVEIIKGPGSLQYGSDGLGGVINIMPGKILPANTFSGSVLGIHKTNNQHWGGSARLGFNLDDVFVTARYSRQDFADYRVPASQFIYNTFVLPIFDEQLKNTAGNEESFSIAAGIKRRWGVTRFHFSRYFLEAGLFAGAVGRPLSYALSPDGNTRDIDVPKQEVTHYRFSINHTFMFGRDHLAIDAGFQRNFRQEFSFPEFHSIPSSQIDPNNTLAMELELETFSVAAHYEHYMSDSWKNVHGFNLQWQQNQRGGFEFLLPNFQTFRGGFFTITEKELKPYWILNAGLRLDYGENQTSFFRQFVWDSNENITDSLIAPVTDDVFFNWSASLGSNLTLQDGKWVLKANIGKSFRVPYPAETVSNGIHHGTFRHEVGTPDLQSEQGYQLDLSADWNFDKFYGSIAVYFNYFDNYIYLGPTFPARFSPLPESGQIFKYRQDDAIYTGGELQWTWDFFPSLQLRQAIDFVQSYNPKTRLALPFTPQPSIRTDLRYSLSNTNWFDDFYIEINHQYHFAAQGNLRVDRSEVSTPAYELWGLGTGLDINWKGRKLEVSFQVQNLFDTFYLAHLSRYRLINVPEQGRNFIFTLKVPFSGNLSKVNNP